jgi:hypothetical protein
MSDPRDLETIEDLRKMVDSQAKGLDAMRKALFTSISGICQRLNIQNCRVCEREDCCDNTNPQIKRLKAAEAVVEAAHKALAEKDAEIENLKSKLDCAEMRAYNRGVCCFESRQPMIEEMDRKDKEIDRLQAEAAAKDAALKAYEAWEAKLIESDQCWDTFDGLPKMDQVLYDDLMACQKQRNAALSSNAGKSFLERLRAAEKVVEAARKRLENDPYYDYTLQPALDAYDKAKAAPNA